MLYSQLIGKTKKEAPRDETSLNSQLLIKGGYIQKEMAGVYAFLPLGYRTLQKIIQVIREEMNAIGGQELLMSSLQNPEIWKQTHRWEDSDMDVWFRTNLKNETELGLAPTHEEPLTAMFTKYVQSYKDLPFYVYQFQTKFRNELRSKSGLMRTREFIMKDLYSFNRTEEDLNAFYEQAKQAYTKIFERLGIGDKTFLTFASGGAFSKYSHEFQTLCESGEDTVYLDRKKKIAINKEVYFDEVLKELSLNKEDLEEVKAVEVGNIFKLKDKYSKPLGLSFTDEEGKVQDVIMGSYGIGPARVLATVAELTADEKGLSWPENIAPYKVHLIGLNLDDASTNEKASLIYKTLLEKNIEVLFDDRKDATAGEKFTDADLIGIPYRVVVSKKTGESVELKKRNETQTEILPLDQLLTKVNQ